MSPSSGNKLLIFFYSITFLITSEILLFRLTPQIFPIFTSIPIIFVGQILKQSLFLITLICTSLFFFVLNFYEFSFFEIEFSKRFIFNLLTSSIVVYSLFYFLALEKTKKISEEKAIIYLTIFIVFLLIIFNYFYFYNLNHQDLKDYLINFFSKLISDSDISERIAKENIVENIIRLIPSINAFTLLNFIIVNFLITNLILKKLNFIKNFSLNLKKFFIPTWFFLIFNALLLLSFFTIGELKYHISSTVIILSFLFFYQGFIYMHKFMEKFEINVFLKFLIIFLLFIFLGYVLLLTIFMIGYFKTLINVLKRF